jgi:hypothetical protein
VVILPADADELLARLVKGVATLSEAELPRWALVGGLAVMVQLMEAHRATQDVDAAVDDNESGVDSAIAVLVADGRARSYDGEHLVLAEGTRVDVIRTGAWTEEDLPDDDLDRLFVVAHCWAVEAAVCRDLAVVAREGTVLAEASVPIALPATLVAMKLQSCRRHRRAAAKAASDVYDMYRLLGTHDRNGAIAGALATAPGRLGEWCAAALEETFVASSARWARRLGVHSRGPAMGSVAAGDLEVVGSLCAERIRALLAS